MDITKIKKQFKILLASFEHSAKILLKWLMCSVIIGLLIGLIGSLFYWAISAATTFRTEHAYIHFLLPLSGLLIIGLYQLLHSLKNSGTTLLLRLYKATKKSLLRCHSL